MTCESYLGSGECSPDLGEDDDTAAPTHDRCDGAARLCCAHPGDLPARCGATGRHHHRSPELLSDEQIQAYLLYLLQERQRSRSTVNVTSCAVRFLVCDVLGQVERRLQIPMGRNPQRLPEVLSRAEVAALLGAPMSMKAHAFLTTAYASGLRQHASG